MSVRVCVCVLCARDSVCVYVCLTVARYVGV